ncbi:hypothetical protein [Comamonas testosteroni]|jgi:hypothetical protein|uniref:hypothetical protein n=1 Tax=Comamonas testosteroni TaxID=285 RepID=UPI0026F2BE90|nr:hypothetical protein [Comamonas testosteroni]
MTEENITQTLEWASTLTGLSGAYLLATNSRASRWGWVGFTLANFFAIGFALRAGHHGLFVQQLGFMGSSVLGMYRSGLIKCLGCKNKSQ